MTQIVRNFVELYSGQYSQFDITLLQANQGQNIIITSLRMAVNVSSLAAYSSPIICDIKLDVSGGNPITIRRVVITPTEVRGDYIDLIAQFSLTQGWVLAEYVALIIQFDKDFAPGDNVVIFGIYAEEPNA